MTFYSKKGTRVHGDINKFFKHQKQNTEDVNLINHIKYLMEKHSWVNIETEIHIKAFNSSISGVIDALFKNINNNEYIIIDWKYTNHMPSKTTLNKYNNIQLNRLTKFHKDPIMKYILQLNLYKLLLLSDKNDQTKVHKIISQQNNLHWENVNICIIFLHQNTNGLYQSRIFQCTQFNNIDLMSLLYDFKIKTKQKKICC